ncbi:fluoride efflux transporter CrcB [Paenibacillus guangzhouensis]|uniref:fluoride efflux transporter CrcB n=1 Tax=Paenibacillus guangzhouensis TaxID=1473112 RepID=UPI0012668FAA|nr:fluoride efflux transporter CrcB [Paenibacillus guangzhouensis]
MMYKILAVGAGGFVGALLRYGLSEWVPPVDGFPWGILVINWSGCLFLGWLLTAAGKTLHIPPIWTLALGTGLTGAFTTFSTFAVETFGLLDQGRWLTAIVYILSSVIGGLLLAYLGVKLAAVRDANAAGRSDV